jgi:hypothetical protein
MNNYCRKTEVEMTTPGFLYNKKILQMLTWCNYLHKVISLRVYLEKIIITRRRKSEKMCIIYVCRSRYERLNAKYIYSHNSKVKVMHYFMRQSVARRLSVRSHRMSKVTKLPRKRCDPREILINTHTCFNHTREAV